MTTTLHTQVCLVLLPALLWASLADLLYRRIANRLVLALLLLWPLLIGVDALNAGHAWPALLEAARALPGALAVVLVGFGLFRLGRVGAGDVKLMAVVCLWVGASQQLAFILIASLAGGLLALLMPLLMLVERMLALSWWSVAQRLPMPFSVPQCLGQAALPGIPYALAIALGALATLFLPVYS
ncbi:prepilin peptidase [Pseudomonas putida]